MDVLVIRHAISEANIMNALVCNETACLTGSGMQQARKLGSRLVEEYGIDILQSVAVSELLRTQQTATEAGFVDMNSYAILDEVRGVGIADLRRFRESGELPIAAVKKAEAILEEPPKESVWFSSGFVIASLCVTLGIPREDRLIPDFCGITNLKI